MQHLNDRYYYNLRCLENSFNMCNDPDCWLPCITCDPETSVLAYECTLYEDGKCELCAVPPRTYYASTGEFKAASVWPH
jgi:hypothetical protein